MTIGERIADLRKKNGFSQEILGEKLGVSRQAVSKWESDAALPEIDKLVEMAKLFDVTVGVLLGVEKARESQENAGQENGVEEIFEKYLDELSKAGRMSQEKTAEKGMRSRRIYGLLAAATGVCVVILFVGMIYLKKETADLQNQINALQESVDSVSSSLDYISSSIAAQVESILSDQNSILTRSSLEFESADYENKTVVMRLEAVPKETVDSVDDILFTARLSDGETLQAEDVSLDEAGVVTAQIELPMENDIDFYLRVGENTVWLSDEGDYYDDLLESLVPTFEVSLGGTISGSESAVCRPYLSLYVSDAESEVIKQTDSAPEVSLWLMRGEDKVCELDYEKIDQTAEDERWGVQSEFELNAEDMSPAVEPGEEFRVYYEVDYGNGAVFSGTTNEYFVYEDYLEWGMGEDSDESESSATYYIDNY